MPSGTTEPAAERTFLGERLWPGVTLALALTEADRLARATQALRRAGHPVSYLRSMLVPGDETLFVWFSAPAASSVAEVGERAGVRFDRIGPVIDLPTPALNSPGPEEP